MSTPLKATTRLLLKTAEAAVDIAGEELPDTATRQEIEDYAVELMRKQHSERRSDND